MTRKTHSNDDFGDAERIASTVVLEHAFRLAAAGAPVRVLRDSAGNLQMFAGARRQTDGAFRGHRGRTGLHLDSTVEAYLAERPSFPAGLDDEDEDPEVWS